MPTSDALALLERADIELLGRMPYSSNGTFLVDLTEDNGEVPAQAIYKPERGEQPLWDFPPSLYKREVAAFLLSEQLGWGHVPPTIVVDGPLGIGSLQLFVPAVFEEHYFTMLEDETKHAAFRQICAFDIVANNTDRKSGHVLLGEDGELHAIDNGLSFHAEFKLRTVIWDFANELIPTEVRHSLENLMDEGLHDDLAALLDPFERDAVLARARVLAVEGSFPDDPTGRRWPWPMV
jgi:uncharacterized repeat protein (TIGR03843 family)